jgi:N-sulfoglucosamine sulfohydrolase
MKALEASGEADNTFLMFLSDHGMPLPFAKTQLYHHSTHTPLIVRWPGVTKPGTVDEQHMVSAVDFLPTLLDVVGMAHPEGMDGRTFASLLKGDEQEDRQFVIKEYNENAGASRDPMRAVQTKQLLYLFNPWSNGERVMATATSGTPTYRRMAQLANTDETIAARHRLYQHRVVEELYDVETDPNCLVNLIDSPKHQQQLAELRETLENWMVKTDDHMLDVYRQREDAAVREAYVQQKEAEAAERRKARKGNRSRQKGRNRLITLGMPKSVTAGGTLTVTLRHKLTEELGEQMVHVTLKGGPDGKRIERKVMTVSGEGTVEVTFDVPATVPGDTVRFAAFIGKDYDSNLQHLQTNPVPVRDAGRQR